MVVVGEPLCNNDGMSEVELDSTYVPDEGFESFPLGSVQIDLPGLLTIANVPVEGQSVSFRVDWIDGVGVRPTAITVTSTRGEEVTSTDLRNVNAKNLYRAAIVKHVTYQRMFLVDGEEWDGKIMRESPLRLPDDVLEKLRLQGPRYATLSYVVDMYMFADSIGLAPALYVQQMFATEHLEPLPRTTATKWIKKARDMGLFEEWFEHGDD